MLHFASYTTRRNFTADILSDEDQQLPLSSEKCATRSAASFRWPAKSIEIRGFNTAIFHRKRQARYLVLGLIDA